MNLIRFVFVIFTKIQKSGGTPLSLFFTSYGVFWFPTALETCQCSWNKAVRSSSPSNIFIPHLPLTFLSLLLHKATYWWLIRWNRSGTLSRQRKTLPDSYNASCVYERGTGRNGRMCRSEIRKEKVWLILIHSWL